MDFLQFLKIGELNEAHRAAYIAWDKFYRNIKVELAKSPTERLPPLQLLKHSKEEFDRLMETSPPIPENIIELFKITFSDGLHKMEGKLPTELSNKQKTYLELKKPEICDTIESVSSSVYQEKPVLKLKRKPSYNAISIARKTLIENNNQKLIKNIINIFKTEKGRLPTSKEIYDEIEDKVQEELTINEIDSYLKQILKKTHEFDNVMDDEYV